MHTICKKKWIPIEWIKKEKLVQFPKKSWITNFSLLSVIIPYFGLLHDIDFLLKLINKKVNREWMKMKKGIWKGIFNNLKATLIIRGSFDEHKLREIFIGDKYLLYKFQIEVKKSSYKWLSRLWLALWKSDIYFDKIVFSEIEEDVISYNYHVQKFILEGTPINWIEAKVWKGTDYNYAFLSSWGQFVDINKVRIWDTLEFNYLTRKRIFILAMGERNFKEFLYISKILKSNREFETLKLSSSVWDYLVIWSVKFSKTLQNSI